MAKFFGEKLSENMRRTPEGYLICLGAVIGRTGWQKYFGRELPQNELDELGIKVAEDEEIKILRDSTEVFKQRSMNSFEGKTFCYHHPSSLLDIDTVNDHSDGHIQNVRPGDDPLDDGNMPLLADIVVTDKDAIYAIEELGLRELSGGYNYHLKLVNGTLMQVDILGNHVALVENGRAGSAAKIQDSIPTEKRGFDMAKMSVKVLKALGLQHVAKTATPEEFATALDAAADERSEAADAAHGEGCECKTCKPKAADATGKDAERERYHKALDRMLDSKAAKDAEAAAAEDADMEELTGLLSGGAGAIRSKKTDGLDSVGADEREEEAPEGEDEGEEEAPEGEDEGEEEEGGEGEDEAVQSNASPEIPADKRSKTAVPSATDSAYREGQLAILKIMKPIVAKSGDKKAVAAMDAAMKRLTTRSQSGGSSYRAVAAAAGKRNAAAMDSLDTHEKAVKDANAMYAEMRGKNTVKK